MREKLQKILEKVEKELEHIGVPWKKSLEQDPDEAPKLKKISQKRFC